MAGSSKHPGMIAACVGKHRALNVLNAGPERPEYRLKCLQIAAASRSHLPKLCNGALC